MTAEETTRRGSRANRFAIRTGSTALLQEINLTRTTRAEESIALLTHQPRGREIPVRTGGEIRERVDTARIFVDFDGSPLAIGDVSRAFIAARSLARLPEELTIHTLRHTFASWLASSGVPLHTIAKLLGHTGPQMTTRYAHLTDGARREAVDVVSRIVSGEQAPPERHHGATVSSFPLKS